MGTGLSWLRIRISEDLLVANQSILGTRNAWIFSHQTIMIFCKGPVLSGFSSWRQRQQVHLESWYISTRLCVTSHKQISQSLQQSRKTRGPQKLCLQAKSAFENIYMAIVQRMVALHWFINTKGCEDGYNTCLVLSTQQITNIYLLCHKRLNMQAMCLCP